LRIDERGDIPAHERANEGFEGQREEAPDSRSPQRDELDADRPETLRAPSVREARRVDAGRLDLPSRVVSLSAHVVLILG
jgi:hypothetical protein